MSSQLSSTTNLPRLPVEIVSMIFAELGLTLHPQQSPLAWRTDKRIDARTERIYRALTLTGRYLHYAAQQILYHTVHVGTELRAKKLLVALEASFLHPATEDGQGGRVAAWREEGYLRKLIKAVRLDIEKRETGGRVQGAVGFLPQTVEALAAACPELETLDISCGSKGGWLDGDMILALRKFDRVKSMEIQSTGYDNAASIFTHLDTLEDLKLKSLHPGWADEGALVIPNMRFHALPRAPDPPILFGAHLHTLVLVRCALDPATTLPALFQTSGLNPQTLKHLVISKAVGPPVNPAPSFALAPDALEATLAPFVPTLEMFHLDLFDVPPITQRTTRDQLQQAGLYARGRYLAPDTGYRPATTLAASLGPNLSQFMVGGPMNVDGARFFEQLSNSQAGGSLRELILSQCGRDEGKAFVDGVTVDQLLAAVDMEWASGVQVIDVQGMEEEFGWDWEGVGRIEEKLRTISEGRFRSGGRAIVLRHAVSPPRVAAVKLTGKGKGKRGRDDGGSKSRKGSKK